MRRPTPSKKFDSPSRKTEPSRTKTSRTPVFASPSTLSRFWLPLLLVVPCLLYTLAFLTSQISEMPISEEEVIPLTRARTLFMLLVPEEAWRAWTAEGIMPLGVLDRLPLFAAAGAWLLLAYCLGKEGLVRFQLWQSLNRAEQIGLALAGGLHALSWVTFTFGVFGGLHSPWWLVGAIGFCIAWLIRFRRRQPLASSTTVPLSSPNSNLRWQAWMMLVGVVISSLILFGAVLPPGEFDVREYHLQAPKEFLQAGAITFNAHNVYANMPLGVEMHSLAWMRLLTWESPLTSQGWFYGGLIGKLIIASLSIIGAVIVGGLAARQAGSLAGWIAATCYLTCPGIAEVSRLGLIDASLGCYAVACFAFGYYAWQSKPLGQAEQMSNASSTLASWNTLGICLSCGWFLGAAISCKYTAVPMILLPMLLLLAWVYLPAFRKGPQFAVKQAAIIILMLTLSGGGWYLKNAVLIGNPVYPLAGQYFATDPRSPQQIAQWNTAHQVPPSPASVSYVPDFRVTRLVKDLWLVGLQSRYLGLLLVPLALWPLSTLFSARQAASRADVTLSYLALAMAGWMLLVWWLGTHRLERFVLPLYPMLAVSAGIGGSHCIAFLRGIPFGIWLGMGAIYAIHLIAAIPFSDLRIAVSLDALRYDRFREHLNLPAVAIFPRVAPYQQWLNANLKDNERVLLVGDAQVFDLKIPHGYSTCFDRSLLEDIIEADSVEASRERLRQANITHIVVHWGEIGRYRQPGNYGFSDTIQKETFEKLVSQKLLRHQTWPILSETADLFVVEAEPQEEKSAGANEAPQ